MPPAHPAICNVSRAHAQASAKTCGAWLGKRLLVAKPNAIRSHARRGNRKGWCAERNARCAGGEANAEGSLF
jgi:hypothetical protein